MNGDFTDYQFETMKDDLLRADDKALVNNGFWKEQLDMDLAMRTEYKKGQSKTPAHNILYTAWPGGVVY